MVFPRSHDLPTGAGLALSGQLLGPSHLIQRIHETLAVGGSESPLHPILSPRCGGLLPRHCVRVLLLALAPAVLLPGLGGAVIREPLALRTQPLLTQAPPGGVIEVAPLEATAGSSGLLLGVGGATRRRGQVEGGPQCLGV